MLPFPIATASEPRHQIFISKYLLTCVSAAVAEGFTFPIDATKTRMQLAAAQGRPAVSQGAISLAASVIKAEGLGGLYAGVAPAVVRHLPYTGTRIAVYEHIRGALGDTAENVPAKMCIGATAGAMGQLVSVPADLIKVRMQSDRRNVANGALERPRYTGMANALATIVRREGILGLWQGTLPAVQRAALVNLGELAAYDTAKQAALDTGLFAGREDIRLHLVAGATSGFVATVASTPMDVLKTRLMSQSAENPRYKGAVDCLVQSVRTDGIGVLYRGFWPTWARLGPWQLTFWTTYEQLRSYGGLGGF